MFGDRAFKLPSLGKVRGFRDEGLSGGKKKNPALFFFFFLLISFNPPGVTTADEYYNFLHFSHEECQAKKAESGIKIF